MRRAERANTGNMVSQTERTRKTVCVESEVFDNDHDAMLIKEWLRPVVARSDEQTSEDRDGCTVNNSRSTSLTNLLTRMCYVTEMIPQATRICNVEVQIMLKLKECCHVLKTLENHSSRRLIVL